jgi:hypothetical protein
MGKGLPGRIDSAQKKFTLDHNQGWIKCENPQPESHTASSYFAVDVESEFRIIHDGETYTGKSRNLGCRRSDVNPGENGFYVIDIYPSSGKYAGKRLMFEINDQCRIFNVLKLQRP